MHVAAVFSYALLSLVALKAVSNVGALAAAKDGEGVALMVFEPMFLAAAVVLQLWEHDSPATATWTAVLGVLGIVGSYLLGIGGNALVRKSRG